jgi:ABC-type xylose transport system, periplasmic component
LLALAAAISIVLAATASLSACKPKPHRVASGKAPVIGFSLDSLVVERWKRDLEVFTKAARDLGAELIVEVADQDPAEQDKQVRELAERGIDVLVIVPNDADRLSSAVRYAKSKGLPVLSYDRLVRKAGVDLYVSFDNEKVGFLMGEAIAKAVPSGNCVIINGAKSDYNAIMLGEGVHRALAGSLSSNRIRIIDEIWPSAWDSDEVKSDMEALVSRSATIDAVIAGNDMLAEAAINVLAESRIKAKVTGQDAELSACQRIVEGSQYATVYKPIERLALKAAGFAVMLAKGESIETDSVIDDGVSKVPYVRLEPILVTKETLASTVIKDGFHTATEIYRNVKP